jgi:hypothetical protein
VPHLRARRSVVVVLAGLMAALVSAAGVTTSKAAPVASVPLFARTIDESPGTKLHADRLALTAIDWRGGPIVTSTGETVTVLVSNALDASVTPESWAEFIAHLPHGSEISKLTTYIAPLDEVQQLCGAQALGCYGQDELVSIGETLVDGTTPDEVVRHEYGHHIAYNRTNPPWVAVDWGPKYWASSLDVCARVTEGSAFPGDEALHYDQNPGEAWAETYRLYAERQAGILTTSWPIVSSSYFPTEAAYAAAERDVLQPWSAGRTVTYRRQFTRKGRKVWLIHLQTPLDGNLSVSSTFPKGGLYDASLVDANRHTVLKHGFFSGTRTKRFVASVCGQRSLFVRVTQKGTFGRVSVTASTP